MLFADCSTVLSPYSMEPARVADLISCFCGDYSAAYMLAWMLRFLLPLLLAVWFTRGVISTVFAIMGRLVSGLGR